ncbi:MAG: serine/threonine protein kinase, partial [Planctomycetales bacterium]|nr:serine/threonine protein kinase [Planctomycetales bacterium]
MTRPVCEKCQTELDPGVASGLCPVCLLQAGLLGGSHAATARASSATAKFAPPEPHELAPHFPGLEIRGLIGSGGMGAVYLAHQKSLSRLVALKILPREVAGDPLFAERFNREARTLAQLNHPHIVTVYEAGKSGDWYFLQMEYVDGITLRQAISDGRLDPPEALTIVQQVCDALAYAHEMRVVHRDIKPENVLIDRRGRVKIADFGLAKLLGDGLGDITLTRSHQVMGTFLYMAPEQIAAPNEVDHRADLYSLGVLFYEILTGHMPVGRFELPSEMIDVDSHWDDVVLRALERSPQRRFQLAGEMHGALSQLTRRAENSSASQAAEFPSRVLERPTAPPPKPSTASDPDLRLGPPLAFTLGDDGALGSGLARMTATHLEIEFHAHFSAWIVELGRVRPGLYVVGIPWERIYGYRLERTLFTTRLRISSDSLQHLAQVPGSRNGELVLKIRRHDREAAERFCDGLKHRITVEPSPAERQVPPTPFVKTLETEDDPTKRPPRVDLMGIVLMIFALAELGTVMACVFGNHRHMQPDMVVFAWIQGTLAMIGAWSRLSRAWSTLAHVGAGALLIPLVDYFALGIILALLALFFRREDLERDFDHAALRNPNPSHRFCLLGPYSAQPRREMVERESRPAGIIGLLSGVFSIWLIATMTLAYTQVADTEYPLIYAFSTPGAIALFVAGGLLATARLPWITLGLLVFACIPMGIPHLVVLPVALGLLVALLRSQVWSLAADDRSSWASPIGSSVDGKPRLASEQGVASPMAPFPGPEQQVTGIHRPPRVDAVSP